MAATYVVNTDRNFTKVVLVVVMVVLLLLLVVVIVVLVVKKCEWFHYGTNNT